MKAVLACLLLCLSITAWAQSAPTIYFPPLKDAEAHAFPQEVLREYLAKPVQRYVIPPLPLEKQRPSAKGGETVVAEGIVVAADAPALFGAPIVEQGVSSFLAEIEAPDAQALRLELDLSGLTATDELWVVDPTMPHAFGPFTARDQEENSWWTPTTEGAQVVLMLRTTASSMPPLRLERVSYFFSAALEKQLPCPIDVICETDAAIQQAATAVGRVQITTSAGATITCSGSLLEAPATPEQEGYFLSAQHCFRTPFSASAVEVIWDFRAATCGAADPPLASLPRSRGIQMLATDALLDFAFMELNNVPVGALGRAYLGWNLQRAAVGDAVVGIHHPRGTSMKLAFGNITVTNVSSILNRNQNEINWLQGITEGGSSGSPALYADDLTLSGVLSNGNVHTCGRPELNFDNYGSFPDFYPAIACYLEPTAACEPTGGGLACAAKSAFGEGSQIVTLLREFRDQALGGQAWGRAFTRYYYDNRESIAAAATASPEATGFFRALAYPAALYQHLIH